MGSEYDRIHDLYDSIDTVKAGARYERLAGVVFAAMERDGIVIVDRRLRGTISTVAHQIDVVVEKLGKRQHMLIECKDYDISGDAVGLGIVRDFQSVVADIKPDVAWIISCNRFTRDARKFAKAFGIKLATLRAFLSADWTSRIHTIVVGIHHQHVRLDQAVVTFAMSHEDLIAAFKTEGASITAESDPIIIFDGASERQSTAIIQEVGSHVKHDYVGDSYTEKLDFSGWLSVAGAQRYPLHGMTITFPIQRSAIEVRISADQAAARLLLSGEDGLDFVLWEDALQGYSIDEQGEVHLANEHLQKRLQTSITQLS